MIDKLMEYGLTEEEAKNTIEKINEKTIQYAIDHCVFKNKRMFRETLKVAILLIGHREISKNTINNTFTTPQSKLSKFINHNNKDNADQ